MTFKNSVLTLFLSFILFSCSNNISLIKYNDNIKSYQVSFIEDSLQSDKINAWKTLRNPQSMRKITNKDSAEKIIFDLNSGRDIKLFFEETSSIYNQYSAAHFYFKGINEYKSQKYNNALLFFNKALKENPGLLFTSDISFLKSRCFSNISNFDSSSFEYNKFLQYSESTYPKSFYLETTESDSLFLKFLSNSENIDSEIQEKHFTNSFHKPALKSREYPGLLPRLYNQANANILFTFFRDNRSALRLGGAFELIPIERLKFSWEFYGTKPEPIRFIKITYQVYRTFDNRFGINGSIFTRNFAPEIKLKSKTGGNIGFNITTGYFFHPRFALHFGYDYHIWNENNPKTINEEDIKYKIWNKNRYFTGMTYFVFDNIGISTRYDNLFGFQFGIYLNGHNLFLF